MQSFDREIWLYNNVVLVFLMMHNEYNWYYNYSIHDSILSSACQNFGCYNGGTPETTDLNGEKTCVCKCMPGISGDHCEETKGTNNNPNFYQ